jgi:hypothetical protein
MKTGLTELQRLNTGVKAEEEKPKSLRFEEPTKGEMSRTSNTSQESIFSLNSNKIYINFFY